MKKTFETNFYLYFGLSILVTIILSNGFFFLQYRNELNNGINEKLLTGARITMEGVDATRLKFAHEKGFENSKDFIQVLEFMENIVRNFGFKYIYYMIKENDKYIFVYDTGSYKPVDGYQNAFLTEYTDYPKELPQAWNTGKPTISEYTDKWGSVRSIFMPIKDASGQVIATIGIDYSIEKVKSIIRKSYIAIGFLVLLFLQALALAVRTARSYKAVKQLSQEVVEKNAALLSLDRLKDEFLANTSHELRTPLHGIIGIAESLIDGTKGALPDGVKNDLSLIKKSGQRLSSLIDDILDFSRMENRDISLIKSTVDLNAITSLVFDLLRPLADKKNLYLQTNIPENARFICADENRIVQVLINLVGNAIKFTHEGGIILSSERCAEDEPSFIKISIADTGIGIPPTNIEKIFNAFEQGDGSVSRSYGGTGLGLAIAKKIIELHGGSISVYSESGKGSIFSLKLKSSSFAESKCDGNGFVSQPKNKMPEIAINVKDEMLLAVSSLEYSISEILIVDDDEVNIKVLENHLAPHHYATSSASDGFAALDMIGKKKPDLVLLDIMMPKMSGLECAERIRSEYSLAELPVIMLTAKNRSQDIVNGFAAGANDYLTKPFGKDELLARVKTHLQIKEAYLLRSRFLVLEEQLVMARKIQMSTIPEKIPQIPGLQIAARYIPMESVGGDFYDFKVLEDGKVSFFIADVCGHGIPAAFIASMVHIGFNTLIDISDNPLDLMTRLRSLMEQNIGRQFVTAACCVVDTRRQVIRYVRAGHEPMMILNRKDRKIINYQPKGPPIGFPMVIPYEIMEIAIEPGDRIILFTDGIPETTNSDKVFYDKQRFEDILCDTADLTADEACDTVLDDLKKWSGRGLVLEDDLTLMIIDMV